MSCTPEQYIDEYGVPPPGLEGYGHHNGHHNGQGLEGYGHPHYAVMRNLPSSSSQRMLPEQSISTIRSDYQNPFMRYLQGTSSQRSSSGSRGSNRSPGHNYFMSAGTTPASPAPSIPQVSSGSSGSSGLTFIPPPAPIPLSLQGLSQQSQMSPAAIAAAKDAIRARNDAMKSVNEVNEMMTMPNVSAYALDAAKSRALNANSLAAAALKEHYLKQQKKQQKKQSLQEQKKQARRYIENGGRSNRT